MPNISKGTAIAEEYTSNKIAVHAISLLFTCGKFEELNLPKKDKNGKSRQDPVCIHLMEEQSKEEYVVQMHSLDYSEMLKVMKWKADHLENLLVMHTK